MANFFGIKLPVFGQNGDMQWLTNIGAAHSFKVKNIRPGCGHFLISGNDFRIREGAIRIAVEGDSKVGHGGGTTGNQRAKSE